MCDYIFSRLINSRLLAVGSWAEGDPQCPGDLMMGRAKAGMPAAQFETGQQLVKRFKAVQQAKEEFWDRGVKEVFPSLLKQGKWYKYKRDAKVGDIVPRKDVTATGKTYKYARIIGVHVGLDGKVRLADVEYKVPGESKFRMATRLIHKLVLVVPVEEQTMEDPEDGQRNEEERADDRRYLGNSKRRGRSDRREIGAGRLCTNRPEPDNT